MALCAASAACSAASVPDISLDLSNERQPVVVLAGLSRGDLRALEQAQLTADTWPSVVRVSVDTANGPSTTPIAGTYTIANGTVRFTPMLPFEAGRRYVVVFTPTAVPNAALRDVPAAMRIVSTPAPERGPAVRVTGIYPTGPVVPANLLRMYVEFSAPMGTRPGDHHIELLDAEKKPIEGALLPLDTDLWDGERRRFTILFDPGRVKRGILPNRAMGRPLRAGGSFTIVVKREWPDAQGQPLASEFRKEYQVGPAIERAIDLTAWRIDAPAAESRGPLVVTFAWALDHAILQRGLRVKRDLGSEAEDVPGDVRISPGETQWTFVPSAPWRPGKHLLLVEHTLEDPAGNRYYAAFEDDAGRQPKYGPTSVPFTIR